jgi:hypothetical protein
MRRDADKAEDFARRHGVPRWYSRAKDLINDPEVNAITSPRRRARTTSTRCKSPKRESPAT